MIELIFSWFEIFYLFIIYSFLGWCTEVSFQAISHGKIVNRGFLNGPVCPIYGVGVLVVLLLLEPYSNNIIWLFIGGMFLTTFIELVGGWILDAAFHMRWWDYSEEPYNYRGYICIRFAIIWGLAIVGVVKIIQPLLMDFIDLIPHTLGLIIIIAVMSCFVIDLIVTIHSVIGFTRSLGELDKIAVKLHDMSDNLTELVSSSALKADHEIKEAKTKANEQKNKTREALQNKQLDISQSFYETIEKMSEKRKDIAIDKQANLLKTIELEEKYNQIYNNIKTSFGKRRLLKAYPKIHRSENKLPLNEEIVGLKYKILRIKNISPGVINNKKNKETE